ncbi:N2,N2-dimethylguanosine tRNA methyltransferase [Eremomyces bilateralis CBS 781.70]|uniref:tRNA (guanine(26)-N(2))-dimethyltransferase n=1 Tax=Eremomyces bilateralis CBS 781.70 TaxID=1392243 RepID=A0A6G1G4S0_9PEZI|nr:N2,N2-dimethylguanosine tRNA methyltransferase [Eremomyces bilateralis CBS 781.70]KAF1812910.1 N2,N2-dimethylguanosine tRNA methyltransferase [Eremomyces bilateralis CBS 781.70]
MDATTSSEIPSTAVSLDATPSAGQAILHNDTLYTTIKEGLAHILVPQKTPEAEDSKGGTGSKKQGKRKGNADTEKKTVFYNPIQQFNRDLTVIGIRAFGEDRLATRPSKRKMETENGQKTKRKKRRTEDGGVRLTGAEGEEMVAGAEQQAEEGGDVQSSDAAVSRAINDQGAQENGQIKSDTIERAADEPYGDAAQPASPHYPPFRILDALSATGLRALRYSMELPFVTSVTANDLSSAATEMIGLNSTHNKTTKKIIPVTGNAMALMYSQVGIDKPNRYDVIDLDPYGTAAPFLDGAIQAMKDGGLMCVTCTDAGVFASAVYPEKTFALYGGMPVKGLHGHEAGLRLILHAIASAGAKYGIAIEPLLSLSIDFYARVFVRVHKSPMEVKFLAGKTMLVYSCDSGCGAWTTQLMGRNVDSRSKNGTPYYRHSIAQAPTAEPHCDHCGFKTHLSGPMYAGPIHNYSFVQKMLDILPKLDTETYGTVPRIEGMLQNVLDERISDLPDPNGPEKVTTANGKPMNDPPTAGDPSPIIQKSEPAEVDRHPFYIASTALAKVLHCVSPSDAMVKGALRHAGYRAARTHARPGAIKTDAPWSVIWRIMTEWIKQKAPIKEGAVSEGSPGWRILFKAGLIHPLSDEEQQQGDGRRGKNMAANGAEEEEQKEVKIVFDEKLGKDMDVKKYVRYQVNPEKNWGPMRRAKG